jgi:glucose-6-phosphate isomerase
MLKAVTRFDAFQELAADRERAAAAVRDNAARLSQTRNNRAQAAVVPSGAGGRRAPESSVEAAFEAGFRSQRV